MSFWRSKPQASMIDHCVSMERNVISKCVQAVHIKTSIIQKQYIPALCDIESQIIHCCKSWFSSRGKGPRNNNRSSTLVQRSNNVLIWTDIPLFTSPFFRDSYCLYTLWNNSHSKNCILVVKNYMVLLYTVLHTEWDPPPPPPPPKMWNKKRKIVYLNLARSLLFSDRLFGQNKPSFERELVNADRMESVSFFTFLICVCVFCGECGCICIISICVDDNSKQFYSFLFITQIILIFLCQINHICLRFCL